MKTLKYSRQRECIKEILMARHDHPTADDLYMSVREQYPNISLGTIYRNLSLLASLGEIRKLSYGDGADHFDGDISPHYHAICRQCGCVKDLPMPVSQQVTDAASQYFDGQLDSHDTYFYGICTECKNDSALL